MSFRESFRRWDSFRPSPASTRESYTSQDARGAVRTCALPPGVPGATHRILPASSPPIAGSCSCCPCRRCEHTPPPWLEAVAPVELVVPQQEGRVAIRIAQQRKACSSSPRYLLDLAANVTRLVCPQ